MTNLSVLNFDSKFSNNTTKDDIQTLPDQANFLIAIVINIITCPFTVLLNVLVIMAVKRRPRLQSNANILLACLAASDASTGVVVQPTFILATLQKLEVIGHPEIFNLDNFHNRAITTVLVCSLLHLAVVTFERLTAIRFTIYYPYIIRQENIKKAVAVCWLFSISLWVLWYISRSAVLDILLFILPSSVLFIAFSYLILYRETSRHKKKIKTEQLHREEVERFFKENKAFMTTVFLVGAVLLCFAPSICAVFAILITPQFWKQIAFLEVWIRNFAILNSLLNPLIYCWRQREMRKFVFRFKTKAAVNPAD